MQDSECLFCKIINCEIPSEKVYEDATTYAFKDINPKAKVHVLVVPRDHYANVGELAKATRRCWRTWSKWHSSSPTANTTAPTD